MFSLKKSIDMIVYLFELIGDFSRFLGIQRCKIFSFYFVWKPNWHYHFLLLSRKKMLQLAFCTLKWKSIRNTDVVVQSFYFVGLQGDLDKLLMVIKKLSTLTKTSIWRLESKCMQVLLLMSLLSSSGSGEMSCVHLDLVKRILMLILGFTSVSAVDIDL